MFDANKTVISKSRDIIERIYGKDASIKFDQLCSVYFTDYTLQNLNDDEQIASIRDFWNRTLMTIPNTTVARSWLYGDCTMEQYLIDFESNWLHDVYNTGLLS